MVDSLMETMERWLRDPPRQPPPFNLLEHNEFDQHLLTSLEAVLQKQNAIGWAHFFCGRISKAWRNAAAICCSERRPDEPHNPTLWARKAVDQLWEFYITLWQCRNGELHGHDFEEQKEVALTATRATARRAHNETQGSIAPCHTRALRHLPVEEICFRMGKDPSRCLPCHSRSGLRAKRRPRVSPPSPSLLA